VTVVDDNHATALAVHRHYNLNMPQMALGGLSEAWLFRELGDLHWSLISNGLGAPSSELSDANGDRLYATFTRLYISSTVPLRAFEENDQISASAEISRFGGGVFFGEVAFGNDQHRIHAKLMSSFTKRSSSTSNLSLLKGQPTIPANSAIPVLAELPQFAQDYRTVRASYPTQVLFECDYEILPYHDINGVGLLYFAAYPIISDLCEMKYFPDPGSWCMRASTISRDVHYYGNCDIHDSIVYRLHGKEEHGDMLTLYSSLSRKSDDTMIARLITCKVLTV